MKNYRKIIMIAFLFILCLALTGCAKEEYMTQPLGDGFGFWDIFVYPMAGIMWCVAKTIGFGSYPLTIIFSTIIVRSLAWPIYAKTNDMQYKMQLMQPEVDKIQAKYAGRQDQESQQRMQMETMQLYKKYGVGLGGCIMPFVQMPIFLGFYYAIRKLPTTMSIEGHWLNIFKTTELFGIDMTKMMDGGGDTQKWGVIILAILVGVTQVISIIISEIRQKKAKEEKEAGIPEYRKAQSKNPQTKTTNIMMKGMLYFFAVMMVVFVIKSPAGLGLYWVIGNIYSTGQTALGQYTSKKKLEKEKAKQKYQF